MNTGWSYEGNYLRKLELTDGESTFIVTEIEVFKVEFNWLFIIKKIISLKY